MDNNKHKRLISYYHLIITWTVLLPIVISSSSPSQLNHLLRIRRQYNTSLSTAYGSSRSGSDNDYSGSYSSNYIADTNYNDNNNYGGNPRAIYNTGANSANRYNARNGMGDYYVGTGSYTPVQPTFGSGRVTGSGSGINYADGVGSVGGGRYRNSSYTSGGNGYQGGRSGSYNDDPYSSSSYGDPMNEYPDPKAATNYNKGRKCHKCPTCPPPCSATPVTTTTATTTQSSSSQPSSNPCFLSSLPARCSATQCQSLIASVGVSVGIFVPDITVSRCYLGTLGAVISSYSVCTTFLDLLAITITKQLVCAPSAITVCLSLNIHDCFIKVGQPTCNVKISVALPVVCTLKILQAGVLVGQSDPFTITILPDDVNCPNADASTTKAATTTTVATTTMAPTTTTTPAP